MLFSEPVVNIIRRRKSIRTYLDTPLEENKKETLNKFISENVVGPFGTKSRFIFITSTEQDKESLKGLITYGMIKNPTGFIIGAAENSPHNLEDYGYLMEKNILKVTDLNLGTCWLGGTFNSSGFAQKIALQNNEVIPAVTPVGYAVPKITLVDSVIRNSTGADKRKSWSSLFFNKDDKPLSVEQAGRYETSLEMVRLAPSASNLQPWRIIKENDLNTYHFYIKRNPGLKQIFFMKSDLQRVDIGIGMCHFELAAEEKGLKGVWEISDPHRKGMADKLDYTATWVGSN
ncbi:MAG: nitroreductase [Deltaproteobacteria bacterium HGW-Deltaproteobacteria-2]|jgi:nitroreductase|nr:MAG: nitroreductase [Deltaproteobacteria bacterium HGW-Deltaproteobacteria-2]